MDLYKLLDQLSDSLGRPRPERAGPLPELTPCLLERRERRARKEDEPYFVMNAEGRGSRVIPCSQAELQEKLQSLLAEQAEGTLLAPSIAMLHAWGIEPQALGRPLECWEEGGDFEDYKALAAIAPVSISPAISAVASLGMILQASSAACPRSLSLLPPVHICLLAASSIRTSIKEALDAGKKEWKDASQMIFVAGPSSTGDIENIIVTGVHGPVEEIILLVEDR